MYHLHDPLPSLLLTSCMNEVRRKQIYIALSGKWDGGSMHAIVNRTYRCTIHTSQMKIGWYSFSFLHTTINHWRTTLRNLHDDICLNKHIYYIMSWEICQVALLQCGSMNQGMHRSQMKIEWYFSTSHNNQPYSNVICEMRDHWWTLEIKFVSIMIRLNTIVQQHISIEVCRLVDEK